MPRRNLVNREAEATVAIHADTGLVVAASAAAITLLEDAATGVVGAHCADLFGPKVHALLSSRVEDLGTTEGFPVAVAIRERDGAARFLSLDVDRAPGRTGRREASAGEAAAPRVRRLKLEPLRRHDDSDEVRRLDWALSAFSRATTALLRSQSLENVVKSVCEAIVHHDAYILAAVALAEPLPSKRIKIAARAGEAAAYLDDVSLSWAEDDPAGNGPTGLSIRSGRSFIMRDAHTDPSFEPWRARAIPYGIRSSVTVPFSQGNGVLGVLIVYASETESFGPREMDLFQRLAEQLAFAIVLQGERSRLLASEQERRAAEAAETLARKKLEESEARYRLLADRAKDIIIHLNRQLVIEYVSPAVRQLGYTPEALVGRSINAFLVPADPPSAASAPLADLVAEQSRQPHVSLFRVLRADGGTTWLESSPTVLRDDAGEMAGMISILRDVTERLAIERELEVKRSEAEAATVAKTQFLANMSHEIRTPLTVVLGFATLMEGIEGLPEKAQAYIGRIKTGGNALLAIVNDVLDLSRLEAGKIQLAPRPVELANFVDETVDLIRANAAAKGCQIRLKTEKNMPARILADPDRLRQILFNLLSNAVKFGGGGGVEVRIASEKDGSGRLRIAVADEGPGIAPEDARRLFQRFSQVDASNTRQNGGAGLGLAICKGLSEMMGGAIGVESVLGVGSTFWFTFHAPPVEGAAMPRPPGDDAKTLPALRVLVADDVEANREIVGALLEPFNVSLREAQNGAEAVEAAEHIAFDVILMDMQMPIMDGLEACKAIRAGRGPNRTTPILALSANVLPSQVEACRRAGMNDHVGKPINPAELLHKIACWTDAEAAAPEVARVPAKGRPERRAEPRSQPA